MMCYSMGIYIATSLIKNLSNLKSIKLPIFYWHTKCLATKASRAPHNYVNYWPYTFLHISFALEVCLMHYAYA